MKKTPLKRKAFKKKLPKDETLDSLLRRYVRLISGGYCKRCKRYVGMGFIEAAHMYRRGRKTVRWDLRNVYPLCNINNARDDRKGCHQIVDDDHFEKTSFMYDVMNKEEVEDLQRLANLTLKDYPIDRVAIKEQLNKMLEVME